MKKFKVIGLLGRSGTGKNTVADNLRVMMGEGRLHVPLLTTSRPKRPLEIEGREYHFVKKDEAIEAINAGEAVWASCFNDWYYYLPVGSLNQNKINLMVLNPAAAVYMMKNHNDIIEMRLFELTLPDKELWQRLSGRPDLIEVCRRWPEDIKDFSEKEYMKLPICRIQNDNSNITTYMLYNYILGMDDSWAKSFKPHIWNPINNKDIPYRNEEN